MSFSPPFSGVKLTIKPILEPPLPKLTIKTNVDHTEATITTSNSHDDGPAPPPKEKPPATIPKLTIKPIIQKPDEIPKVTIVKTSNADETVPKLTIKTTKVQSVVASVAAAATDSQKSDLSPIPKLTLKTNSIDGTITAESTPLVVPKLILKVSNSAAAGKVAERVVEPPPPPEPILIDESESESNLENSDHVSNSPTPPDVPPPAPTKLLPLEVKTSTTIVEDSPHSPRIILKINKTVSTEGGAPVMTANCVTTTEEKIIPPPPAPQPAVKEKTPEPSPVLQENIVTPSSSSSSSSSKESSLSEVTMQSEVQPTTVELNESEEIIDLEMEVDDEQTQPSTMNSKTSSSPKKVSSSEPPPVDFESLIANEQTKPARPEEKAVLETPQRTRSKRLRNQEPDSCETKSSKKPKIELVRLDEKLLEEATADSPPPPPVETKLDKSDDLVIIDEDSKHSSIDTPTVVKRGRGRPKKVVKETPVPPPKGAASEKENIEKDGAVAETSTPKRMGRPPKRGRGGRVVEVVKDGKVMQVKMDEGYEQDDSPTFSIYNRYYTGRGRGRGRGKRGSRGGRGGMHTPDKHHRLSGEFMTPDRKVRKMHFPVELWKIKLRAFCSFQGNLIINRHLCSYLKKIQ